MQSGPHTKFGPGGAPGQPFGAHVGKHVAGSQTWFAGNGAPVLQSAGHAQLQLALAVLHVAPFAQPPQSGRHSTWHCALHV